MATVRERGSRPVGLPTLDTDLPTADSPQYVNEDGFEVDAQTFAQALQQAAGDVLQDQSGSHAALQTEDPAEMIDGDVLMDEEIEVQEAGESELVVEPAEDAEPLMSLSESNVLHYSVVAGRQHHLQHLLPHIFSHPAIPANSRPRARPAPKGTFQYPTPPPLVHPLPHREYHAPTPNTKKVVETTGSPAPDATDAIESKRRKYGRNKGKGKADENEAPAHDIECIARVTLSVGPFSFPDTELWVGRFVQPRAAAPKPPRVKKPPGERKRPGEGGSVKRPTASGTPLTKNTYTHGYTPRPPHFIAGPSGPGYRPRPPLPAPTSGLSGPPRPPPAPRAELSPDLIKRVNEAATQHSWLSQIIHKAARSQATKEELAKLGRVVNRLKEGKDVGESAQEGITPGSVALSAQAGPSRGPPRPPQSAVSGPSSTSRPAASTTAPFTSQSSSARQSPDSVGSDTLTPPPDQSDDESDVDMKGPEQVGGGGPDDVDPDSATKVPPAILTPRPPMPHASTPPLMPSHTTTPWTSIHPSHYPSQQPTPYVTVPSRDSSSFASPPPAPRPPVYSHVSGQQGYQPHPGVYAAYGMAPPGPPPPRPTYNLPPPFLLVAFKEAPTEKFQIPLGSLSYISRVGEKDESTLSPTPAPSSTSAALPLGPTASVQSPLDKTGVTPTNSRTRGALVKDASTSAPTVPEQLGVKDEPAQVPKVRKELPTLAGMPRLAGHSPPDGTVLISTFVPATGWNKPDWDEMVTRLPFGASLPDRAKPKPTEVKVEPSAEMDITTNAAAVSSSPRRLTAKSRSIPELAPAKPDIPEPLPVVGKLLNIAAESFLPEEGGVHAVTIRLSEVTDQIWQRLKTINGMVTTAEMKSLSEHDPDLMPKAEPATPSSIPPNPPQPGSQIPPIMHQAGPPPPRPPFLPSAQLRTEYASRKKGFFRKMLSRAPARRFLRYRLAESRSDLLDATTDKWGPKPYPISTKASYNRDGDYDGQPIPLSPVMQPKRGNKRAIEPEVTFELPVSLDQLDEMVAENALKGKKGKGMDGRKRSGKRWVPGTICEGCAKTDKRVWRSGPTGPRSLCNSCGDLFSAGELGPLAAPGAAHKKEDGDEQNQAKGDPVGEPNKTQPTPAYKAEDEKETAPGVPPVEGTPTTADSAEVPTTVSQTGKTVGTASVPATELLPEIQAKLVTMEPVGSQEVAMPSSDEPVRPPESNEAIQDSGGS